MIKQIFLVAAIIAVLSATIGFSNQVQAVPKECAGNPHNPGTSGNPHDLENGSPENGNPQDPNHQHHGEDTGSCPGAK
jgi:hypothetical protein